MNRRTWTLLVSVVLVVVVGLLGGFVQVPYVALGPGPTYDTLGSEGPNPVVRVDGHQTFPTNGHLNMTTVSLTQQLSVLGALELWTSGRYALAPRELYFPPGKTEQQVEQQNTREFDDSQTSAETAALRYLRFPMKVIVKQVVNHSPADGVLAPGDQLMAVNGRPVTDANAVHAALAASKPGDSATVNFRHANGPERAGTVRLAANPNRPGGAFLGVGPAERPDVDFDVKIGLADVGGPSAGLMFSLAILDKLTPGDLAGGQFVAGTGEIDENGNVGRIGGIPFKMVKAREAGATSFLVPAGNCSEAAAQAPEGMQLVKVNTLDDAVRALGDIREGKAPPRC